MTAHTVTHEMMALGKRYVGIACWGMAMLWLCPGVSQAQTIYTWLGTGTDNFLTPANYSPAWSNTNANQFLFGESNHYELVGTVGTPGADFRFHRITFTEEAGAYTFSGNARFYVSDTNARGVITNNSRHTQTILNDITSVGNPLVFYAENGDFVWGGNATGSNTKLTKAGLGKLTVTGDHTDRVSEVIMSGGELVLDFDSANFDNAVNLTYDLVASSGYGTPMGTGSTLRIMAAQVGVTQFNLGNITFKSSNVIAGERNNGGSNRIILDARSGSGLLVNINQIAPLGIANDTMMQGSTLNFKLVGNSVVTLTNALDMLHGINPQVTVTSGGKTGFATSVPLDPGPGYTLERNQSFTLWDSGTVSWSTDVNYRVASDVNITANVGLNSVTIQSGATQLGGTFDLDVRALLIEEGVGDFHLNRRLKSQQSAGLFVHQYSEGIFYANAGVGGAGKNHLYKTGSGAMVITNGGTSDALVHLYVQEGRLDTHSSMTGLQWVHVNEGGVLGGSATLGSNALTFVVRAGAVLDGGNNGESGKGLTLRVSGATYVPAGAMPIAGLLLDHDSIYRMTIGASDANSSYTPLHVERNAVAQLVILGGLELILDYVPELGDRITLLIWNENVTRSGQFVTVNGEGFHGDDEDLFFLDGYEFRISYDDASAQRSVYLELTMIPEPNTVVLLVGVALAGMVWGRRRGYFHF
jgi:hypothetical protein